MTEEEFCSRWLTIGTESKLHTPNTGPESSDSPEKKRPLLGEKGIGRLAIATIGPQVLVLTRAKRNEVLSNLVVAFVNWRLFECPGIDLEDIDVPIRTITKGELPTKEIVAEMVSAFSQNVDRLKNKISLEYYSLISTELKQFNIDPQNIDSYLGTPSLRGNGAGTHFIILPSSDLLPADIDGESTTERATPLTKALLGFANTMTPDHSPPVIRTAFRDHRTEENHDDLIAEGNFFTSQEFLNADHHVCGVFDEFGQFKGSVSIYGEIVNNHIIPWKGNGTATACGPFKINFATIQGEGRNSTLPPEEHAKMVRKMNSIGGIYIYRDGIRILPYGDADYDWIDIEFNRTKSASYYYFSYRRMFGVIEIDHTKNAQLSEKAGREGFRENHAYRQLKSILKNFFIQIAADFFRKEGLHSEMFEDRKEQLEKTELDRRRREQQVAVRRVKLATELKNFFENVSANKPQEQALELSNDISDKIKHACQIKDTAQAATEIIRIEQLARIELQNLEARYTVMKPRIALSKAMQKDWQDYTSTFSDLTSSIFRPTRELIEGIVGDEAVKARIKLDRRLRVETALKELIEQAKLKTKQGSTIAKNQADKVASEVRTIASSCVSGVETELRSIISEFERTDISALPDRDFIKARDGLESRITKVAEDKSMLLDTIQAQLDAIDFSGTTSALDQLVAVEQRNVLLEEEAESDLQLAQLGMAVEIINHEFNGTIRSLRSNLRRLQAWADINKDLQGLYTNIRASFDHLDSYLTLFTPLQRRLQRNAVDIRGTEIHSFLPSLTILMRQISVPS